VFLNISRDLLGINPWDGTTNQVSSFGKRKKVMPGVMGKFQEKCVDLKPGRTLEMAELEGPGLVTRIWVAVPYLINPGVTRNLVLRAYFDDEDEPSVEAPLGDLFGTTFGKPREYASAYLGLTSGAFICFFPMPFRKRARFIIENDAKSMVRLFFYQITYLQLEKDLPAHTPYFHCRWRRERCSRGGPPYTVLETEGRGLYLGCHLDMQGRGYPWGPNPLRIQMPEGFGMGMLEGWERIWIDGAEQPNVHGTGGEDYFNGAWYFTKVPSTWLTHGVTQRSYSTRRVSCYRFHVEMPIYYQKEIKVTLDHGLDNLLPVDMDGTTYWYQIEPHQPFDPLPSARERRPIPTVKNRLIMAAPLAYCAAACGILYGVKSKKGNRE
jgi:D-arabinan exo alpha-(1,3)/(1,5)-arabinofuranosidase (non-reducing end)